MKRRVYFPIVLTVAVFTTTVTSQSPQFRTGVDIVQLNVSVTEKTRVISDLVARDFEVLDNGVRQEVVSVSRETVPIDVTMALDTSESVQQWLQNAIVSAANKIRERLKREDRLSVLTFNQLIHERVALMPASRAQTISLGRPTGQTSLNDVLATVLAVRAPVDRRQLAIVFTDGYDTTSLLDEDDVLDMARRSQTAMFFVSGQQPGLRVVRTWSPAPNGGLSLTTSTVPDDEDRNPSEFFHRIAAATGGVVQVAMLTNMRPSRSSVVTLLRPQTNMLDEPFIKALDDFRTSYVVSYSLAGVPRAGWHEVTVRVKRPGTAYQIRTRNGYIGG